LVQITPTPIQIREEHHPVSNPTVLRSRLFKNLKIDETIGKGGRELNLIPLGQAVDAATDKGRASDDDM